MSRSPTPHGERGEPFFEERAQEGMTSVVVPILLEIARAVAPRQPGDHDDQPRALAALEPLDGPSQG
jgi:hypothetical protein